MRYIQILHDFSLVIKYLNISVTFIIAFFQFFHCKSEHKQESE